jgi:hypothetical protein
MVCNSNDKKYLSNPDKYICNDTTGKWVLKTGAIGKKLLQSKSDGGGNKPKCNPNDKKYVDNPHKYICNEASGKWVLKTGDIGKKLLQPKNSNKPKCDPSDQKYSLNPGKYICNDATGKWVLKTGAIGKKLNTKFPSQQKPNNNNNITVVPYQNQATSLYKNQLYKTSKYYNITIPILDNLGITYETWNNKDNSAGTCFWHAISKGLNVTIPDIAKKIENMSAELPDTLKNQYKTKLNVAQKLKEYKTKGFGMNPKDYWIVPKVFPDTVVIIFALKEVKPKQYETIGVFCIIPENTVPTKVVFLCDIVFYKKGGHIELMTLKGKNITPSWSQNIKDVSKELKSILTHTNCQKMMNSI